MATPADDRAAFVSGISKLAKLLHILPRSVPLATANDRINTVFKNIPSEASEAWEVFNVVSMRYLARIHATPRAA